MKFHAHAIALVTCSLVAAGAHAAKPVCGDGKVQASELCDGSDLDGQTCLSLGFDGGQLACAADCTLDASACTQPSEPVCGDGLAEGTEECDGGDDVACPGACSAHCACPAASPRASLEVHVIDVGQGDSILVISPDGFVLLIDSGEESESGVVEAYLSAAGISGLDYSLVTHMHTDHLGAQDLVIDAHPELSACFDHGGSYSTTEFSEYISSAADKRQTLLSGQTIDLGPSMLAEVLHADTGSATENNNSVVLRLTYGGNGILLGGDCESVCENDFNPGLIDVYKVHHHGSDSGSRDAFLATMQPLLALISVGIDNTYGHPDQSALDRLTAAGAEVHQTALDGDLVIYADGQSITLGAPPACQEDQTRACGQTDVGACEFGTQTCTAGAWGDCVGAIDPIAENCDNGLDDDCDAATDGADSDCAAPAAKLLIAQVAYDTPGTDAIEEFVDLYNPGAADVDASGYQLVDNLGTWALPAGSVVRAGSYLSIARDAAGFEALYGLAPDVVGLTLALGNTGDVLALQDGAGAELDRVAWENFEAGWSLDAPIGDAIERADPSVDTDGPADWLITSPATPRGGTSASDYCGDGVCDPGEDCLSCLDDCVGRTGGKPTKQYCCGNGTCEAVGEDAANCSLDCG